MATRTFNYNYERKFHQPFQLLDSFYNLNQDTKLAVADSIQKTLISPPIITNNSRSDGSI